MSLQIVYITIVLNKLCRHYLKDHIAGATHAAPWNARPVNPALVKELRSKRTEPGTGERGASMLLLLLKIRSTLRITRPTHYHIALTSPPLSGLA